MGTSGASRARLLAKFYCCPLPAGARASLDAAGRYGRGDSIAVCGATDGSVESHIAGAHSRRFAVAGGPDGGTAGICARSVGSVGIVGIVGIVGRVGRVGQTELRQSAVRPSNYQT